MQENWETSAPHHTPVVQPQSKPDSSGKLCEIVCPSCLARSRRLTSSSLPYSSSPPRSCTLRHLPRSLKSLHSPKSDSASPRSSDGGSDGNQIPIRIYAPVGPGPFPVTLYFHGGGFVIATIDTYDASARALANYSNSIVISVEYRKVPEAPFSTASIPTPCISSSEWAPSSTRQRTPSSTAPSVSLHRLNKYEPSSFTPSTPEQPLSMDGVFLAFRYRTIS